MKKLSILALTALLFGCAQGRIDILDSDGSVVGYCSADFNFHWHGAQDSVNYILYLCAKEHLENGYRISDESILANDYTIPVAPNGAAWNEKLAKEQYSKGFITEEKLGYILASIEYAYWMKLDLYKEQLASSKITQLQYDRLLKEAKEEFEGV